MSYTMIYIRKRAEAEQRHGGREKGCVEDLFLAMLKLCEIRAQDFMMLTAATRAEVDEEIDALAARFRDQYQVDTTRLRGQLRRELARGAAVQPDLLPAYLSRAEEIAQARGEDSCHPCDLLDALVEKPTETLLQVCDIANWDKPKKEPSGAEEAPKGEVPASQEEDEMSLDYLPRLTARIRRMRGQLLNTVQGQDHVVHAFAEGIFAAEVLAAGDEKRQRPRAIFAFIGPPGVGKTFLAEQGAAALDLPYKRFDMSTYADQQAYMGLVGFEKSYHDAKEGMLTGFVKEHPHSILLLDEIETAHLNTIQLFLQILDAGRLADRYHGKDVSFRDTILIFTSNAGRSLYEGEGKQSAAGIPRKTLLGALETEKDPRTGRPFFPAAITSRLATGWPLLFNHLAPHDLEKISSRELTRFGELFRKQYSVGVRFDDLLSTALLFREGGAVDARTLRAQTELFFKNEVFKVCRLWGEDRFPESVSRLEALEFKVETDALAGEVRPLFFGEDKPEILLYGDPAFVWRCRENLPDYVFHTARSVEEALAVAGEKEIRLVLLDITEPGEADPMATVFESMDRKDLLRTGGAFDFMPMAASAFRDGVGLFRALHDRLPELPVYLLETRVMPIDDELTMSFVRAGARGKLAEPGEDFGIFEDQLAQVCRELYLQGVAARLASERKVLSFDTAPMLSEDGKRVAVRLRDFSLKRAAAAEDAGSILDEVEKPRIRFSDVIGASDAKDELQFFIQYLKNPKQFSARGLKPPKGVLLYGPPGTGKTMLAKAMAGESDVAFLPAAASSFVTKWQGSGPQSVRDLFQRARRYAPSIIFIDEIDAIGRKRAGGSTAHGEEMALNALLTEMDGFSVDPKRPVFVLAATNFDVEEGKGGIGVIDPALARRFDRKILVDLPNEEERDELLRLLLSQSAGNAVTDEMIARTARRAVGMSPANLTAVADLANRMAVKAGKPLDDAILDEAFELTRHGEKKDWGYETLERVARHESGHAFLCCMAGRTPAYLTIVARGSHGGYMEHDAGDIGPLSTKQELLGRIRTSLAGRASELVYYGPEGGISTGASGDLEHATRTAAAMLCAYGMDEDFGLAAMDPGQALKDPAFRARVNQILRTELETAVSLIEANRRKIDRLVDALLAKNKLTGPEMEEILKD